MWSLQSSRNIDPAADHLPDGQRSGGLIPPGQYLSWEQRRIWPYGVQYEPGAAKHGGIGDGVDMCLFFVSFPGLYISLWCTGFVSAI